MQYKQKFNFDLQYTTPCQQNIVSCLRFQSLWKKKEKKPEELSIIQQLKGGSLSQIRGKGYTKQVMELQIQNEKFAPKIQYPASFENC